MPWEFTDDVEGYADRVWDLLAARPVENTVALGVLGNLRAGQPYSAAPPLFGWYATGGTVAGAVSLTPPHGLLLAEVPPAATSSLVDGLRAGGVGLVEATGEASTVAAFAEAWTAGRPLRAVTALDQRLYALGELRPPDPWPAGYPRRAYRRDGNVVLGWLAAFAAETGTHEAAAAAVRARIAAGWVWLWQLPDGVVALAAHTRAAVGVARIAPVYTAPAHRRRGYGAAVTAACSAAALHGTAERLVLFADLANPTSNAIYRRLGYAPVRDHALVRFEP